MGNDSVERFKREAKSVPEVYLAYMRPTIIAEAERLAADVRAHCPIGPTRHLYDSIRVERGPNYDKNGQMLIKAGGPLTTKEIRTGSGVGYDYSLATEFGTQKETAEPFFFPTYRADRVSIQQNIYNSIPGARGVTPWDELQAIATSPRCRIIGA